MAYHYRIELEDSSYTFRLYPNNSNIEDIGRSDQFQTDKECRSALKEFQSCGTRFRNDPTSCEIIRKGERFYFYFHFGNGNYNFYRKKGYEAKRNCKNAINSIIKNIDAPIKAV